MPTAKKADGSFELVELELRPLAAGKDDADRPGSYYPVLGGLRAGDTVVARGGFLLDSRTQIEGKPSLLFPEGQAPGGGHDHGGHMPAAPPAGGHKHSL